MKSEEQIKEEIENCSAPNRPQVDTGSEDIDLYQTLLTAMLDARVATLKWVLDEKK